MKVARSRAGGIGALECRFKAIGSTTVLARHLGDRLDLLAFCAAFKTRIAAVADFVVIVSCVMTRKEPQTARPSNRHAL